jgi:hypothetical protein
MNLPMSTPIHPRPRIPRTCVSAANCQLAAGDPSLSLQPTARLAERIGDDS